MAKYKVNAPIGLSLRSGPGTDHQRLAILQHKTPLEIKSFTPDGWAELDPVYVSGQYLDPVDPVSIPNVKLGVFVSHNNGVIDWPTAQRAGATYANIKITDFASWHDPQAERNIKAAGGLGLPRMLLHYYRNDLDPLDQARWFSKHYQPCELGPCVDCEDTGHPAGNLAENIKKFLLCVEMETGRKCTIYTGKPWWDRRMGFQPWANQYKLHIAAYPNPNDGTPPNFELYKVQIPVGWYRWDYWQWACRVPGHRFGAKSDFICLEYMRHE